MKKLLMAAVALTALATVPAAPAAAQAVFTVSGSVTPTCNYTGGTINFNTIAIDPSTGLLVANQSASSTAQTGFFCNGAGTTLAISHAALTNSTPAATGFTSTISFTPAVQIGNGTPYSGDQTATAFGAQAGNLVVSANSLTATAKPMAGTFGGSITLTLTPNS